MNSGKIPQQLFTEMLNSYRLSLEDFKEAENNQLEFSRSFTNKLFKKKDKNFHTITSKDDFNHLTDETEELPFLIYQPLNDHSRPYLEIGDILFSYRNGQFNGLDNALQMRGIYGLGIALSNPMKISNENEKRHEYKDYCVLVFYPFKLQKHLSVRDIQLNPITINLTPYNGNRNDSLQHIPNDKHYKSLSGMILYKNPHLKKAFEFINVHVEPRITPDILWNRQMNKGEENNIIFDYKTAFKNWLIKERDIKPKSQSNYISAINTLNKTWNTQNDNKIDIWVEPYIVKDQIGLNTLFNDFYIDELNQKQNNQLSAAIKYYFTFLDELSENCIQGINRIYFGAPGTGKSYTIEKFIKKNGIPHYNYKEDYSNVFRLTLHPEFTYTDFVGQIMPVVTPIDESHNKTRIEYKFTPQMFTRALRYAFDNMTEPVFLILEEMSRSNVAAVFGDLFQLLDRDENGESEYRIDNSFIASEIWNDYTKKIYLPNNFFILGTVNTSDQNVFVMDTAFKRRFEFEYIDAQKLVKDQNGEPLNNFTFHFLDDNEDILYDWATLYRTLNDFITKTDQEGLGLSEDKQLGQFFIKFKSNNNNYNYNQFSGKLLEYLWNDVQKASFSYVSIFKHDIQNFSQAYRAVRNGKNVFSKDFLNNLYANKEKIEGTHEEL